MIVFNNERREMTKKKKAENMKAMANMSVANENGINYQ